jgi:hypothetical protein
MSGVLILWNSMRPVRPSVKESVGCAWHASEATASITEAMSDFMGSPNITVDLRLTSVLKRTLRVLLFYHVFLPLSTKNRQNHQKTVKNAHFLCKKTTKTAVFSVFSCANAARYQP